MSNPPYKLMQIADVFTPERLVTFERPKADHDTVIIRVEGAEDFHLKAHTLREVAIIMTFTPQSAIVNRKS